MLTCDIVQYYMPPIDTVNKDFIKQVLADQKTLLHESEVRQIIVPKYEELSVKNLQNEMLRDPKVNVYFPDQVEGHSHIDRAYFFNIVNTIYPEYMKKIIDYAIDVRNKPEANEEKKEFILISDGWYDKLMEHPFISSTNVFSINPLIE